jgi:hypothetical protein
VLTGLPLRPRITAAIAWRLIDENITRTAAVVALSWNDCRAVIKRLSDRGVVGGVKYDALIARAAHKARVARLVTLNPAHFQRVWPEGHHLIIAA